MSQYDLSGFRNGLKWLDIELSEEQIEQFVKYYELLVLYNEKFNLTAITEFDDVIQKHFIDSLSIAKAVDMKNVNSLIDVGTGAGFPGLPIKIAFPQIQVILLDSLNKRVDFLDVVIGDLRLENVEAVHGRAEDFVKNENVRESFDLCVSRAVANLSVLSEYCIPYIKVGGKFISYKSEKASEEINQSANAINILGCGVSDKIEFTLPDSDIYRTLVVIKKLQNTPEKYPRKAGIPIKKPL